MNDLEVLIVYSRILREWISGETSTKVQKLTKSGGTVWLTIQMGAAIKTARLSIACHAKMNKQTQMSFDVLRVLKIEFIYFIDVATRIQLKYDPSRSKWIQARSTRSVWIFWRSLIIHEDQWKFPEIQKFGENADQNEIEPDRSRFSWIHSGCGSEKFQNNFNSKLKNKIFKKAHQTPPTHHAHTPHTPHTHTHTRSHASKMNF